MRKETLVRIFVHLTVECDVRKICILKYYTQEILEKIQLGGKSFSDSLPHGLQRLTFRSVSAKLKKLEFSMTRGGGRDFFRRPDGLQQKYEELEV